MLRIHFTADDLGRVRLASGADPLWETRLSASLLHRPVRVGSALGRWRADVVRTLPPQALPYLHLTPPHGHSPDFLVPEAGSGDLASGLDAVLSTPTGRMRAELALLDVPAPVSNWVHHLVGGEQYALNRLRTTITAYHRHAVAPVWHRVRTAVEADRAARAHALVTCGARETLATLHPRITWSGGTLRVDDGQRNRDIHLAGRGIRLVPAYFCVDVPVTFGDPDLEPTLVLPVVHTPYETGRAEHGDALSSLLGRTRAAALRALTTPVTTGALARRTATSAASASQHAAVLRQAGLVVSRRDGRYVVHTLTMLGVRLLAAADHGNSATDRPPVVGTARPSRQARHVLPVGFPPQAGPSRPEPAVSPAPPADVVPIPASAAAPAMRSMSI